jgi:hypothetical protein
LKQKQESGVVNMFLIVNKVKDFVYVLDTDDGVVEKYKYEDLKQKVKKFNLHISGYPLFHEGGILVNNLYYYRSYYISDGSVTNIIVPNTVMYGMLSISSADKTRLLDEDTGIPLTGISYFTLYTLINVGKSHFVECLYDIYKAYTVKNYKPKFMKSLGDMSDIFITSYKDYIVFYDNYIVVKVRKAVFENIDKSLIFKTKSTINNIDASMDYSGAVVIGNCKSFRMKKGQKYKFDKSASIRNLYVEEGAELTLSKTWKWKVFDLICYDGKVLDKLLKNNQMVFTSVSIPENLLPIYDERIKGIRYFELLGKLNIIENTRSSSGIEFIKQKLFSRSSLKKDEYKNVLEFCKQYNYEEELDSSFPYRMDDDFKFNMFKEYFPTSYNLLSQLYTDDIIKCILITTKLNNSLYFTWSHALHKMGINMYDYSKFNKKVYNDIVDISRNPEFGWGRLEKLISMFVSLCKKYNLKICNDRDNASISSDCIGYIVLDDFVKDEAPTLDISFRDTLEIDATMDKTVPYLKNLSILLKALSTYKGEKFRNGGYGRYTISLYKFEDGLFYFSDDFRAYIAKLQEESK